MVSALPKPIKAWLNRWLLYFAWFLALFSTLGSLFFSEVMHYPPCILCWYQRICMYPLVLIIGTGILKKDKNMYNYALPLTFIGFGFALFHCLLYYQLIPESLGPCLQGISCSTKYIEWFGFITIPLMSLVAFAKLIVMLLIHKKVSVTTK
jgi:disulfide bond formation protein DsbB